jgi:mono/diheme cytochrome c family protein
MVMKWMWCAALAIVVGPGPLFAQTGDAAAGKAFWSGNTALCRNCHGADGEGGFGPDLAGRPLTAAQFTRAVRQPWGVMPSFTEQQVSAPQVASLVAYFDSLPKVAEPGPWRVPVTPEMPLGQKLAAANGCAQCHGAELAVIRQAFGAVAPDFGWFTRLVYTHTTTMPELEAMLGDNAPMRMGNFSPLRLSEPVLQEIWKYLTVDLGFRARVQGRVAPGVAAAGGTVFTVTVTNTGLPGKGLTAEDVSVNLSLPAGVSVVSTTGAGYQGTRKDDKGVDVAAWRVPRMAAKDVQTFTMTLGGGAPAIQAGTVSWTKPAQRNGAAGDTVNIALPPRARASQ